MDVCGGVPCNSSTWEVEARGSGVQGHPQIHSEFEASMNYLVTLFQEKKIVAEEKWVGGCGSTDRPLMAI